jgi:hypothetical protein
MRESFARAAHLLVIRMRASGSTVVMFANARTCCVCVCVCGWVGGWSVYVKRSVVVCCGVANPRAHMHHAHTHTHTHTHTLCV